MRLLVVDDVAVNRTLLAMWLERMLPGCTIEMAAGGKEALALYKEKQFDGVLLDYRMPDMDGREVAIALRQIATGMGHTLAIIMLTADTGVDVRDIADKLVEKPLHIGDIMTALATVGLLRLVQGQLNTSQTAGVPEELRGLLPKVVETLQGQVHRACVALSAKDWNALRFEAHGMRGVAANFNLASVLVAAESLEAATEERDPGCIGQIVEWLTAAITRCAAECTCSQE